MTTRRLAAILAADVVGFSSMMEKDEEGTLSRVKASARGDQALGRPEGGRTFAPAPGLLRDHKCCSILDQIGDGILVGRAEWIGGNSLKGLRCWLSEARIERIRTGTQPRKENIRPGSRGVLGRLGLAQG